MSLPVVYLRKFSVSVLGGLVLSGCSTVGGKASVPQTRAQIPSTDPVLAPNEQPDVTRDDNTSSAGGVIISQEQSEPAASNPVALFEHLTAFEALAHWNDTDVSPGLKALRQSCQLWAKRDSERWVDENRREYGQYQDWEQACFSADYIADDAESARSFFQNYFQPVSLTTSAQTQGMLTGYYEPEVQVRRRYDAQFSEPILSLPDNALDIKRPRSQISEKIASPLAYGQPIDVFFLQIQGSGRLRFNDGQIIRAAFAAHNSRPYTSIGKVLVERGDMTLEQASKQSIEAWMNSHSPAEASALMNENERYVFFQSEPILPGVGPKGAMGVPLVGMGAIAIDPAYHPYGLPVWLETTLPQSGGDYKGAPAGVLVITQDTGGAIKGALRADLFFGSGDEAGELAGVMKHDVAWTILLPTALAVNYQAPR